jgi:putative hydrolases of HD superfamily
MHDIDKFRTIYRLKSINKFRKIYGLKSVYRLNSVDTRHESAAEHTWSSLILADWILNEMSNKSEGSKSSVEPKSDIDRLKVYELLMYHDLVEIHAGDTPINAEDKIATQKEREHTAFEKLITELPDSMTEKYKSLYEEFEQRKTKEAKFAKAIEEMDSSLHELDYKKDWKGWTEKFMREKKTKYYTEFPIIMEIFEEFLKYCNENGFFSQ